MPGTSVFPGGSLEDADRHTAFWLNHVDVDELRLPPILGGAVDRMLPYAVAAVRETWEEAGHLLGSCPGAEIEAFRGNKRPPAFHRWAARLDIRLSISVIGRWSRWITPESMPRRFDTYFFMAPVQIEANCRPDRREAVHGLWIDIRQALVENARGSLCLSPPTLVTLHQMLPYGNLDELLAESRRRLWPPPFMPRLWPLQKGDLIVEPWDPDYAGGTVNVDIDRLERDILPVGAPFSRMWRHRGVCRPVARVG